MVKQTKLQICKIIARILNQRNEKKKKKTIEQQLW